jgi:hypothetical protein
MGSPIINTPPVVGPPKSQKRGFGTGVIAAVDNTKSPKYCTVLVDNKFPAESGYTIATTVGTPGPFAAGGTKGFKYFYNNSKGMGGSIVTLNLDTQTITGFTGDVSTSAPTANYQNLVYHRHVGNLGVGVGTVPLPVNNQNPGAIGSFPSYTTTGGGVITPILDPGNVLVSSLSAHLTLETTGPWAGYYTNAIQNLVDATEITVPVGAWLFSNWVGGIANNAALWGPGLTDGTDSYWVQLTGGGPGAALLYNGQPIAPISWEPAQGVPHVLTLGVTFVGGTTWRFMVWADGAKILDYVHGSSGMGQNIYQAMYTGAASSVYLSGYDYFGATINGLLLENPSYGTVPTVTGVGSVTYPWVSGTKCAAHVAFSIAGESWMEGVRLYYADAGSPPPDPSTAPYLNIPFQSSGNYNGVWELPNLTAKDLYVGTLDLVNQPSALYKVATTVASPTASISGTLPSTAAPVESSPPSQPSYIENLNDTLVDAATWMYLDSNSHTSGWLACLEFVSSPHGTNTWTVAGVAFPNSSGTYQGLWKSLSETALTDLGVRYVDSTGATSLVKIVATTAAPPPIVTPQFASADAPPVPTYEAGTLTLTPYANLQGMLNDFEVDCVLNNVPTDGSVERIAWAIRKHQLPIVGVTGQSNNVVQTRPSLGTTSGWSLDFTLVAPTAGNLVVAIICGDSLDPSSLLTGWTMVGHSADNTLFVVQKVWAGGDSVTALLLSNSGGGSVSSGVAYEINGSTLSATATFGTYAGGTPATPVTPSVLPLLLSEMGLFATSFAGTTIDSAPTVTVDPANVLDYALSDTIPASAVVMPSAPIMMAGADYGYYGYDFGTTPAPQLPQVGDMVVLGFATNQYTTGVTNSNWTQLALEGPTGSGYYFCLAYRIWTGTEPTADNVFSNAGSYPGYGQFAIRIQNYQAFGPISAAIVETGSGSYTIPTTDPTVDGLSFDFAMFDSSTGGLPSGITPPTGWTGALTGGHRDVSIGLSWLDTASATPTQPGGAVTLTGQDTNNTIKHITFTLTAGGVNNATLATATGRSLNGDFITPFVATFNWDSNLNGKPMNTVTVTLDSLNPPDVTGGGLSPWIYYDEQSVPGYPYPASSTAVANGYGQVSMGVAYDIAVAYVSNFGVIGPLAVLFSNYTSPNQLQIANQYMINNTAYIPSLVVGIPTATGSSADGAPPNPGAPIPGETQVTNPNGFTAAYQLAFQVTNQPTDGSLRRIAIYQRATVTSGSPNPWSLYATIPAVGVNYPLNQPLPIVGNYEVTLTDLSLGNNGWDFGVACEDAAADLTPVVFLETTGPTSTTQGNSNLVVDSSFAAANWNTGNPKKAASDPWWFFWNIGLPNQALSQPGNPGEAGDLGNYLYLDVAASGVLLYGISYPITVVPGQVYTLSAKINARNCGAGAYVGLVIPDGTNQGGSPNNIAGVRATQAAGTNGTVQYSWLCPSDGSITEVAVILSSNHASVGTGGYLYMAKPQFQAGGYSSYTPGPSNPTGQVGSETIQILLPGSNPSSITSSPTLTSSATAPTSGGGAPTADQQPQGSIRVVTTTDATHLFYGQTAADPTNPTWSTIGGGGSDLRALLDTASDWQFNYSIPSTAAVSLTEDDGTTLLTEDDGTTVLTEDTAGAASINYWISGAGGSGTDPTLYFSDGSTATVPHVGTSGSPITVSLTGTYVWLICYATLSGTWSFTVDIYDTAPTASQMSAAYQNGRVPLYARYASIGTAGSGASGQLLGAAGSGNI